MTSTPTDTVAPTEDLEVLTHGVELRDCDRCSLTLIAGEACPRGCGSAREHRRGTRLAARARYHVDRLVEGATADAFADACVEREALEFLAAGGSLRAELVA